MARYLYKEFTYICKSNHLTKSWQWSTTESIICSSCKRKAYMTIYTTTRDAQGFKPTIVAYNPKTKEYRHLASDKARLPKGFERQELRTMSEVRKFCKHLDSRDIESHERRQIIEELGSQGYNDPLRDYKPQTPLGAQLMEYAKSHFTYTPRFDPNNYSEAFEFDRSNIERD